MRSEDWLRAPFPWPGGKRRVAAEVWMMLGQPGRYVEPFAGSLGVLLGRPAPITGLEVVNDLDGYIVNVWRALRAAPDETIGYADDVRSEYDLTAKHLWLVNEGAERLRAGLQSDPGWYDAQVAGWWLYGVAMWIGDSFCAGTGSYRGSDGRGVQRQLPHLGNDGQGVHRQLPHLGNDGQGVIHDGVYALAARLSHRLRRVVITNGDYRRCLTPAVLRPASGYTAIYLDPPYPGYEDAYAAAAADWDEIIAWCEAAPSSIRIVLSGYADHPGPRGWQETAYTAHGTSSVNRTSERFWTSPSCGGQLSIYTELGAAR